jgi:hypothetical protein
MATPNGTLDRIIFNSTVVVPVWLKKKNTPPPFGVWNYSPGFFGLAGS